MSNRHSAVSDLLREVQHLTADEAEELYGIQYLDHGRVYDMVTGLTHGSIGEWAEQSSYDDSFEMIEHPREWDD